MPKAISCSPFFLLPLRKVLVFPYVYEPSESLNGAGDKQLHVLVFLTAAGYPRVIRHPDEDAAS